MKVLRRIGLLMCLAISLTLSSVASALPILTENTARRVLDEGLKQQSLFWQAFAIPYVIEVNSAHKDAAMLKALEKNGLLTRKKEMRMIKLDNGKRKKITMVYDYQFADPSVEGLGGFYYGYGKLESIMELSSPYLIGEYYYAEAYVTWSVDDFQSWAADPAFRKARTLRRSKESKRKPFEKRIYLQHDGKEWALWQGKPGAL